MVNSFVTGIPAGVEPKSMVSFWKISRPVSIVPSNTRMLYGEEEEAKDDDREIEEEDEEEEDVEETELLLEELTPDEEPPSEDTEEAEAELLSAEEKPWPLRRHDPLF